MRSFWTSKRNIIITGLLFVSVVGLFLFFAPEGVLAQTPPSRDASTVSEDSCSWYNVFCIGAKWILYAVLQVVTLVASAALVLFEVVISADKISGPTGLLNTPAVYELWKFVRDFFNLFFILTLLFAAFATVFQIEQFSLKKIFLNILLAALLVNFSFPVTRFLIDAANVPMYFFASSISPQNASAAGAQNTAFSQLLSASKLADIIVPQDTSVSDVGFVRIILGIVFMFFFAISISVLAVMMFVRLIALIILLIFSSAGFLFAAFPGMQKYSGQWWDTFWKYAFFGPAAMLMLLVAVKFLAAVNDSGAFGAAVQQGATNISASAGQVTLFQAIVMFSLPVILIWMSISLANSFSIAGASAVTGWGQKMASWAWKAPMGASWWGAKTGGSWAGRKYEKAVTKRGWNWAAPTAVWHGFQDWRKREHEDDRRPVEQAGAEISDKFSHAFKDHTDQAFKNFSTNTAKEQKEISAVSANSDYVIHELINAINNGEDTKVVGALQILASNNDFNDMIHVIDRIQRETGKNFGYVNKETGEVEAATTEMSSKNIKNVLTQMMVQSGVKEELAAKTMLNLSNISIAAGNVGMAGSARFNDENGKFEITDDETQAAIAAAKLQNLETQARQRTLHHNSIFKELPSNETIEIEVAVKDEMGRDVIDDFGNVVTTKQKVRKYGDINDIVGEKVLSTITAADIREAGRTRDDLKREITERMKILHKDSGATKEQRDSLKGMQALMDNNLVLKQYFERIYALQTGRRYSDNVEVDPQNPDKPKNPEAGKEGEKKEEKKS